MTSLKIDREEQWNKTWALKKVHSWGCSQERGISEGENNQKNIRETSWVTDIGTGKKKNKTEWTLRNRSPSLHSLQNCQLKKMMHNLKIKNYVLFGRHTEDLSPKDRFSENSEGLLWRGKGGARIYRSFCKKTKTKQNINSRDKRLLLIKENQTAQVNWFSTFLCVGRCESLGPLKSFLWYAP